MKFHPSLNAKGNPAWIPTKDQLCLCGTQNSGVLLAITSMALEGREFRANARHVALNVGEI